MKNTLLYELMRTSGLIWCVTLSVCGCMLSSCGALVEGDSEEKHDNEGLNISNIEFYDDCKRARVWLDQTHDIPGFYLEDTSQVKASVIDRSYSWVAMRKKDQPVLESLVWAGTDKIDQLDLNLFALVDLTQSEKELSQMRSNLKRLYATYGRSHMFISFMLAGGRVSYVIPATPYVLDTYVTRNPAVDGVGMDIDSSGANNIWLYRCVDKSLNSLLNGNTGTHLDSAARTTFIIMAKEEAYDNISNYPSDPEHFYIQQNILDKLPRIPPSMSVYFLNDGPEDDIDDDEDSFDTPTIMNVLCEKTGGYAADSFDVAGFLRHIFKSYDVYVPDYEAVVCFKDGTVQAGRLRNLEFSFYSHTDSLLASCYKPYAAGNVYAPTVVGTSFSVSDVLYGGLVRLAVLSVIVFITLLFIVPLVRYVIFYRKYVTVYKGPRQSLNSIQIPDTCYMCKAPFKPGDTIVARCIHVVHKECWDENGYHCPEYGHSCPDSSHFYDRKHPYDFRNTPYFTNWVLLSLVATALSWIVCYYAPAFISGPVYWFTESILDEMAASPDIVTSADDVAAISVKHYHMPVYGFFIGFISTFLMSLIAAHRRRIWKMLSDITLKSLVAGVLSALVFTCQSIFVAVTRSYQSYLADFFPWAAMSMIVLYMVSCRSNIRPRHTVYLCVSAATGFLCMLILSVIGSSVTIAQYVDMLYLFTIFNVGVAVALASKLPKRRNSILHLSGSAKEMDFALYKHFQLNPSVIITIGKSVDCALQINWDYETDIAPVHASIRMVKDVHRLFVSDNDVILNGKLAKHDKSYVLYYGDVFQIGKTKFRYLGV